MVEVVTDLCANYPHPIHSNAEIIAKAQIWYYDVGGITHDVFKEAAQIHRQESPFFPTIHDLITICRAIHNHRAMMIPRIDMLEPTLTQEEIKKYANNVRALIRRGKILKDATEGDENEERTNNKRDAENT